MVKDNVIRIIRENYNKILPRINCDNNQRFFNIEILDNPGWAVKVYLGNFDITKIDFKGIKYDNGDEDWLCIRIEGNYFEGYGDITKLEKILTVFCEQFFRKIKISDQYVGTGGSLMTKYNVIRIIQDSYKRICSPYCEDNQYSFKISMTDDPGWHVVIGVEDLAATRIDFEDIKYNNGDEDWLDICLEEYYFEARGDINKLEKILTVFCELFFPEDLD